MNANKWSSVLMGLCIGATCANAFAVQGLDASGNSKVNNALAKKWATTSGKTDGYTKQQANQIVNVGNKRSGNCNLNVGTVQPGQKAPKDIVVTTKDIINVCK
jgi:gas vesicle protein